MILLLPLFEMKKPQTPAADLKPFGDLHAKVESFNLIPGDQHYGYVTFSIVIANKSATDTYGVAFDTSSKRNGNTPSLSNGRGEEFYITELNGIETVFSSFNGFRGSLTDVLPNNSITITGKGQVQWNGKNGDYRPSRLLENEASVFRDRSPGTAFPNLRKYNHGD